MKQILKKLCLLAILSITTIPLSSCGFVIYDFLLGTSYSKIQAKLVETTNIDCFITFIAKVKRVSLYNSKITDYTKWTYSDNSNDTIRVLGLINSYVEVDYWDKSYPKSHFGYYSIYASSNSDKFYYGLSLINDSNYVYLFQNYNGHKEDLMPSLYQTKVYSLKEEDYQMLRKFIDTYLFLLEEVEKNSIIV